MKWIKYFPLTLACTAVIGYLCFFTPPRTSLDNVPLIDKWTHLAMYLFYTLLISIEFQRATLRQSGGLRSARSLRYGLCIVWPVVMGGLIEILQANCTGGRRSGEWADFLADSLGVLLGWAVYGLLVKHVKGLRKA